MGQFISCVFTIALAITAAAAAELPGGFRLEPFVSGLTEPTAVADAPDGKILITERTTGNVRVVQWGELQAVALCTVAVKTTGDGGLLGIAVHPDYRLNHWIYLYYTDLGSGNNKVTRFTVKGTTCEAATDILPDLGVGGNTRRNGGGMSFGPDGMLYVATGDMETSANGQSLGVVQSKILRLEDDGSIPADNPMPGSAIYTVGVRDPRGLHVNAAGKVFASDRGDLGVSDEVNEAQFDGNLGWAAESGAGGSFDPPLKSWSPVVGIWGVADYDGSLFPDAASDGIDNDEDSFGPNLVAGAYRTDDNGLGECVGGVPNGQPCANVIDCLPARASELPPYCDKLDEPAEYCPGGVAAGDDDCDDVGAAGIDEPDESFMMDVFAAKQNSIDRGVMVGGASEQLSNWETFLDSTALSDCPTAFTGLLNGRDGFLYALARNAGGANGALYRIVYDSTAKPREVSPPNSHVPLRLGKTGNPLQVSIYWEDLREDAMQVGDDGSVPTAPVRAYSIWRGQLGNWSSHAGPGAPLANGIAGTAVGNAVRTATVAVQDGQDHYFLVSARGNNLEGTLGSGLLGEYAGFVVTDLCNTIGLYSPPATSNLFKCAPEVTLFDTHGIERHLSSYRGTPVWIDLPAEWCAPCHSEANEMEDIYQEYKGRGVKVISMLVDEENFDFDWDGRPNQAECRAWGDRSGNTPDHTFECWADPIHCTGEPCSSGVSQEAWPKFNAFGALPTNVIVDQGGRVVWTAAGWPVTGPLKNRLNTLVGSTDSCLH